jgi:hypothetical protein
MSDDIAKAVVIEQMIRDVQQAMLISFALIMLGGNEIDLRNLVSAIYEELYSAMESVPGLK